MFFAKHQGSPLKSGLPFFSDFQECLWHSCCEVHVMHRMTYSSVHLCNPPETVSDGCLCIYYSVLFLWLQYFCLTLNTWQTASYTQCPRGCQVIATKNMRLFYHENGLKPHISVQRTLYNCHKVSGEDVTSLSQNSFSIIPINSCTMLSDLILIRLSHASTLPNKFIFSIKIR